MKTSLIVASVLTGLIIFTCGCKKDNIVVPDVFKNTIWTGEFEYETRRVAEPYSMAFDDAGNFLWKEYNGEYAGNYSLDKTGQTITLKFHGGSTVTANLSGGNRLTGINHTGIHNWTMKSGKLNTSTEQKLINTRWYSSGTGFVIKFLTEKDGIGLDQYSNFARKQGTLKFDLSHLDIHYFFVMDDNRMQCLVEGNGGGFLDFELVKQ